jgi:hypothetical protein
MPNDYEVAHQARVKSGTALPASDKHTINPAYLLGHENHFDGNVYTPESMIDKGVLKGKPDPLKQT